MSFGMNMNFSPRREEEEIGPEHPMWFGMSMQMQFLPHDEDSLPDILVGEYGRPPEEYLVVHYLIDENRQFRRIIEKAKLENCGANGSQVLSDALVQVHGSSTRIRAIRAVQPNLPVQDFQMNMALVGHPLPEDFNDKKL